VTRDAVEAECAFGATRLVLVDTGGYTRDVERGSGVGQAVGSRGGIGGMVAERSLRTAREADLALLVLDVTAVTAEDEDLMEKLRPLSEKLLLVVNKVDTADRDPLVWNAHAFGFPSVIGISAAHNRNLEQLKDLLSALLESAPQGARPSENQSKALGAEAVVRVAILGKPNTGKSSLANRLCGEERSLVSKAPGTTRDVVEGRFRYRGNSFQVLDTAGIRRKSRVADPVEYYSVNRAIESIRNADVVLLLIDAAEGLSDQDKKIADQVVKEGRGIILVLNKWDLLEKKARLLAEAREKIRFQFPMLGFAPIAPVSALRGHGVSALLDTILAVWDQLHRRVGTGRLNEALEAWVTHYPLPVRGKNYKIRYAAQISENPVRFVVFVNRLSGFPLAYTQYLENCIRRDLGFPLVPVALSLRQSRKRSR
jgi:GTP-binding protein